MRKLETFAFGLALGTIVGVSLGMIFMYTIFQKAKYSDSGAWDIPAYVSQPDTIRFNGDGIVFLPTSMDTVYTDDGELRAIYYINNTDTAMVVSGRDSVWYRP